MGFIYAAMGKPWESHSSAAASGFCKQSQQTHWLSRLLCAGICFGLPLGSSKVAVDIASVFPGKDSLKTFLLLLFFLCWGLN